MKISSSKNQNFCGHAAGKIKALYMQNPNMSTQIPVYNELKKIGEKHNFDVFIHGEDELLNESTIKSPSEKHCEYGIWAQDNKIILNKDGKTTIVSGLYMPHSEQAAAKNLANIKHVDYKDAELFFEGGNLFLGKKPDGKNYLIIGYSDFEISTIHFYLKSKLGDVSSDNLGKFVADVDLKQNGEVIACHDEYNDDFSQWGSMVIEKLQETFDVEKENITILPQGQYHNDLSIRPLNYPYILVNDEKMSKENIKKLKNFFQFNLKTQFFANSINKKLNKQNKKYVSCDELCERLIEKGFIPIRIGGGYGLKTINFMNAIVHEDDNNLIYITNSGISNNKNFIFLQTLFENDLKSKCPQISQVYFVKGSLLYDGSNIVLEYLKRYNGGIHCLCAEEMQ